LLRREKGRETMVYGRKEYLYESVRVIERVNFNRLYDLVR